MDLKTTQELAIQLMTLHGLTQKGWIFEFDNSKVRFGVCRYRRKLISLSKTLVELNDEYEVKDTILHEIAHALTPGAHHGWAWQQKCIEIGARPNRCYTSVEVNTPSLRYQFKCVCGTLHQRAKKPSDRKSACKCQSNIPWSKKVLIEYVDTHLFKWYAE